MQRSPASEHSVGVQPPLRFHPELAIREFAIRDPSALRHQKPVTGDSFATCDPFSDLPPCSIFARRRAQATRGPCDCPRSQSIQRRRSSRAPACPPKSPSPAAQPHVLLACCRARIRARPLGHAPRSPRSADLAKDAAYATAARRRARSRPPGRHRAPRKVSNPRGGFRALHAFHRRGPQTGLWREHEPRGFPAGPGGQGGAARSRRQPAAARCDAVAPAVYPLQ